jgi:pimeloyl-ACP methyl ester carboxylesterase
MAADAMQVLDHLNIERAHIMGASMGGMIAQTVAIEHPHRTKTLISVMSQPGELTVGQPTQEAMELIVTPAPSIAMNTLHSLRSGSCGKARNTAATKCRAAMPFAISIAAITQKVARVKWQPFMQAAAGQKGLQKLQVPTLVIHGTDDQLITPSGGERTAELIPNSTLLMVDDMGHDMPQPLWPLYIDAISKHTALVK